MGVVGGWVYRVYHTRAMFGARVGEQVGEL